MTEEQKTRLEKYLAKTTVDLSVWEAVLCLDLEAESEADPADNAEIDDEIDEEFSVDRPILGRATDYVKSDHQVKGASQELAGQPSVQPANPSAFHTLTLRISVRTDWTG